jgi:hypothetical protein
METKPDTDTPTVRLSTESAFVVHVAPGGDDTDPQILGRAEHIASGRYVRFSSALELARFMRRTLVEE